MKRPFVFSVALCTILSMAPAFAQTNTGGSGSDSIKPTATAPSDRTSQAGLQPSTQQSKEPKQTGSVAQRNNRQAAKKTDDQHK